MAIGKDDILAALERVTGPDGTPLPKTGKLSEIVVTDGKVFFSITVDAAAVNAWEPVRRRAEAACRHRGKDALALLFGERIGHRRRDEAGRDAVDSDVARGDFVGEFRTMANDDGQRGEVAERVWADGDDHHGDGV